MKSRTRQLDDSKEIQIGGTKDNPIWTTVGELAMSGLDKAVLSDNLKRQQHHNAVLAIIQRVQEQAASFLEREMSRLAPAEALRSPEAFESWRILDGYTFCQDGLTSVIKRHGRVIATSQARVEAKWQDAVVREIERQQRWERGS